GPDSVPALTDLSAHRDRTGRRGIPPSPGGQRWRRLAIPVAAAVAVSLIAATAWLARPGGGRPAGLGPATGGGAPTPPFIVGAAGRSGLAVYSATTGKVLARIPAPGRGLDFAHTAATSNDRSFVVAAARTSGGCYTLFYRLLLTRSGHLASLTRLAVPRAQNLM